MLKILVAGGFSEDNKELLVQEQRFAALLGERIIAEGHMLLNGCMTSFDSAIAESAYNKALALGRDPNSLIVSYVLVNREPAHTFGKVLQSELHNWELGSPRLRVPEPIQLADVVVLVGGFEGSHRAANWARIANKPLLPVRRFGGAAAQVFSEELDEFDRKYRSRITRIDYEDLSQLTSSAEELAETVVSLAERVRTSRSVFLVMSFSEEPGIGPSLADFQDSCEEVCREFGYSCRRVDEEANVPRILPEILNRISASAFTIVDLSLPSPNVYYELGYAEGQSKPVITTAREGTSLPFDVKDVPVSFWENQRSLKEMLRKKVEAIAETQGR